MRLGAEMDAVLTGPQLTVFAILLASVALLASRQVRPDLVAVLVVLGLAYGGVLGPDEALAGFGSEPAIVLLAIFVLGAALRETGVSDQLGRLVDRLGGGGYPRLVGALVPTVALVAAATHQVTSTALLLPVSLRLARERDVPPSRLLMPLVYGATFGAPITLVGAPALLIASAVLVRAGRPALGVFSVAPIGLALAAVATLGMVVLGRRLLPDRGQEGTSGPVRLSEYVTELIVRPDSPFRGKTVADLEASDRFQVFVTGWLRDGRRLRAPFGDRRLAAGDVLLVRTAPEELVAIQRERGLDLRPVAQYPTSTDQDQRAARDGRPEPARPRTGAAAHADADDQATADAPTAGEADDQAQAEPDEQAETGATTSGGTAGQAAADAEEEADADADAMGERLMQAIVAPGSDLAGRSLSELDFRRRYGAVVVGLWRRRGWLDQELARIRLRPGDVLVVYGDDAALARVASDRGFLMMVPFQGEHQRRNRAVVAVAWLVATLALAASGLVSVGIASLAGAAGAVLSGCLRARQAYRAIDPRAYVFVAGAVPLGRALEKSGAAQVVADWAQHGLGGLAAEPSLVLLLLFGLAALSTQLLADAATVAILAPVAASLAQALGRPPEPFVVTVALAAIASLLTPWAHPGTQLVAGPGRYRLADFLRVGLPLTTLAGLTVVILAQALWPG